MTSKTANQTQPGIDAWDRFCDSLKTAGRAMHDANEAGDELTVAEGYRFLLRMIRVGFDISHEFGDPLHPVLATMVTPTTSYEGAGSDARYLHAFIDGTQTYRIRGSRGTAPLIEIGVYDGKVGFNDSASVLRSITEAELLVDADGNIDVVLSPTAQEGNWIATDASVKYLMVRQYSHDWAQTEQGVLAIARQGGGSRAALGLDQITRDMQTTAEFVGRQATFWGAISSRWMSSSVNQFTPVISEEDGADLSAPRGHRFASGYFKLAANEILLCRFQPGEVPFWSIELDNYWYEVIGYDRPETHLNNRSAQYDSEGYVEFAITQQPAGYANELLTLGHSEGNMIFRWSRSSEPLPAIRCRVMTLDGQGAQ